jgi:predicted HD phosphohydrolase
MRAHEIMGNHIPGSDGWAEISSDVYDIARRIREGDESGWKGDPTASVMFNPLTEHFEVWLIDSMNQPYIACSSRRCDHSLILKLIEGDWRKGHKLLEEITKKNHAAEKAKNDAKRDQVAEMADKIHWALLRDIGHLEGGTRRAHSMYTNKQGKR